MGTLYRSFFRHDILDVAAQLAFWALLAIFPFAIFVLTLAAYLPFHDLRGQLRGFFDPLLPGDIVRLFDGLLNDVLGKHRGWLLIVSLLGALWSASAGISSAIAALNRAYDVREDRPFWKVKLIAVVLTVAAAGFTLVAMGALAAGPALAHGMFSRFAHGPLFDIGWAILRWPIIVASMMLAFAACYYLLPDVKQPFHLISPGAVFAVPAWLGMSLLLKLYVGHFASYAAIYGTLGAVAILMMWLYLSSLVVLVGGEINALSARS